MIPVDREYSILYGLLHSPQPSERVEKFLMAVKVAVQ